METQYKIIPHFLSYRVGNDGTVWSNKVGVWKQLKTGHDKKGHAKVNLNKFGDHNTTHRICDLVLLTFVGKCPDEFEPEHINGNVDDNRLENLRYAPRRVVVGPPKSLNPGKKVTEEQVKEIRQLRCDGMSVLELVDKFKLSKSAIRDILARRSWKEVGGQNTVVPY